MSSFQSAPPTKDAAPFVIPSSIAPVERLWACETGGWAKRLKEHSKIGRWRFEIVPDSGSSVLSSSWITDEWVFGYRGSRPAALHLGGDRSLADWAEKRFAALDWLWLKVGESRIDDAHRFDAGGNVLASPPVGGRFPHGRLIVARDMQNSLKAFLRQQSMQTGPGNSLIEIDTSWLQVGHVDELVAFVPTPAGLGFKIVLPDPEGGLRILTQTPPHRALFYGAGSREVAGRVVSGSARRLDVDFGGAREGSWKYLRIFSGKGAGQLALIRKIQGDVLTIERVWDLRGPSPSLALRAARSGRCDSMPIWFDVPDATSRFVAVEASQMWLDNSGEEFPAIITAGELTADAALWKTASRSGDHLAVIAKFVIEGLGIAPERVVRLPVVCHGDEVGEAVGALLPNPVNLVNLDGDALLLRPFGPRWNPKDDDSDLFATAWKDRLSSESASLQLLDGWNSLHRLNGGARCGINVQRKLPKATVAIPKEEQ